MELVMAQIGKSSLRAWTVWFADWLLALALIAVLPVNGAGGTRIADDRGIYYEHAMANTVVQDLDGEISVHVRALRPVVR